MLLGPGQRDALLTIHECAKEPVMPKYVIERELPGAGKLSPRISKP